MVKRGFAREDLFVCVHEQFMTETARMADVVLPATMFMEHDDVYQGGGHQYIHARPEADRAAGRMPLQPRGDLRAREAPRRAASGLRHDAARADRLDAAEVRLGHARRARSASSWIDCQPDFDTAHYIKGFAWPDGKFRFKPDWPNVPFRTPVACRAGRRRCRRCPTTGTIIEEADERASVPARDLAGAQLPQLDLQRDADLARARSGARP